MSNVERKTTYDNGLTFVIQRLAALGMEAASFCERSGAKDIAYSPAEGNAQTFMIHNS